MCDVIEKYLDEKAGVTEIDPKKYENSVAVLPEYQGHIHPCEEYCDSREDKLWSPLVHGDEEFVPQYVSTAQSVLTNVQLSQNVPAADALENVCRDYGLEYILRVLYKSDGVSQNAIDRLLDRNLPQKLIGRWSVADVVSFGNGLARHSKNFRAIRTDFLPHKTTMDIVEFYYAWKRSAKAVKGVVASRARRFFKTRPKASNLVLESPHMSGVVTRSRASRNSRCANSIAAPPRTGRQSWDCVPDGQRRKT